MLIISTKALIAQARYINMRATLRQALRAEPQNFLFNFRMVFNFGLNSDAA